MKKHFNNDFPWCFTLNVCKPTEDLKRWCEGCPPAFHLGSSVVHISHMHTHACAHTQESDSLKVKDFTTLAIKYFSVYLPQTRTFPQTYHFQDCLSFVFAAGIKCLKNPHPAAMVLSFSTVTFQIFRNALQPGLSLIRTVCLVKFSGHALLASSWPPEETADLGGIR